MVVSCCVTMSLWSTDSAALYLSESIYICHSAPWCEYNFSQVKGSVLHLFIFPLLTLLLPILLLFYLPLFSLLFSSSPYSFSSSSPSSSSCPSYSHSNSSHSSSTSSSQKRSTFPLLPATLITHSLNQIFLLLSAVTFNPLPSPQSESTQIESTLLRCCFDSVIFSKVWRHVGAQGQGVLAGEGITPHIFMCYWERHDCLSNKPHSGTSESTPIAQLGSPAETYTKTFRCFWFHMLLILLLCIYLSHKHTASLGLS